MKVFKRALLFFYLAVVVYYYFTLDREKSLAWLEKVAVKVAVGYALNKGNISAGAQTANRQPASPEPDLAPPPPPQIEKKPQVLAYPPVLKAGQTFKVHYRLDDPTENKLLKDQTLEWELVSADGHLYRWEDGDGTSETFTTLSFLPPVSASGNSIRRPEKNKITGDLEKFFPIEENKSMQFQIFKQAEAGSENYSMSCSAGGLTPFTTPAGTFKTIPITCQASLTGFVSEIYYYAPQLNHWIAFERISVLKERSLRLKAEVTGFTFPDLSVRKPSGR